MQEETRIRNHPCAREKKTSHTTLPPINPAPVHAATPRRRRLIVHRFTCPHLMHCGPKLLHVSVPSRPVPYLRSTRVNSILVPGETMLSLTEMSQEQPRRPCHEQDAGIRYGDVFTVTGDLADRPVAPRDAAMMQSVECTVFGHTPKGGAAAVMESAAARNEQRRAVGHSQFSDIPRDQGVTVVQTDIPDQPGHRLVTEYVAGQVVLATYKSVGRNLIYREVRS
ncbi:hypothetical protein BHM03_00017815 [Ensete ventricosum]|nr:hypothetical protein BHM03_00017815 [Ensete ventricosum]